MCHVRSYSVACTHCQVGCRVLLFFSFVGHPGGSRTLSLEKDSSPCWGERPMDRISPGFRSSGRGHLNSPRILKHVGNSNVPTMCFFWRSRILDFCWGSEMLGSVLRVSSNCVLWVHGGKLCLSVSQHMNNHLGDTPGINEAPTY